jgi:hypothetical protein
MNHPLPTLHQEALGTRSTRSTKKSHFAKTLAIKERKNAKKKLFHHEVLKSTKKRLVFIRVNEPASPISK